MISDDTLAELNLLKKNNAAVLRLVPATPGATTRCVGRYRDNELLAIQLGNITIALDYLHGDDNQGFGLIVVEQRKYLLNGVIHTARKHLGAKHCRDFPDLLAAVQKLADMTSKQVSDYLRRAKP